METYGKKQDEGRAGTGAVSYTHLKQISMDNIEITSKVDTEKAGVYTVNYHYTSEETGYDCNANLIVVVE